MSVSSSSGDSRQAHSTPAAHTRHLDHLIDIQDTGDFTAVPNRLMRAFFDGYVPVAKFKLICMMLSHSSTFKIKRSYLDNRFSQTSLKKYLDEIVSDGFVRREKISCPTGGFEWVYHTNRISEWKIPTIKPVSSPSDDLIDDTSLEEHRPNRDPSLGKPSVGKPSLEEPLKKNNDKENNANQMNDDSKTRMDIPDAGHHPSGKVDPSIVEYGIKLQGLFRDQGHYVKYGEVNTWLVKMFQKYGPDEMDQFIQFTKAEHARIWMKCGERPPLFSMKAYLSAFAIWIGSEQRDLWRNPPDLSADDFYFDKANV